MIQDARNKNVGEKKRLCDFYLRMSLDIIEWTKICSKMSRIGLLSTGEFRDRITLHKLKEDWAGNKNAYNWKNTKQKRKKHL